MSLSSKLSIKDISLKGERVLIRVGASLEIVLPEAREAEG